jgi:hypothetical protein
MERAQATRPSSRLLPARDEVIYLPDGVYPSIQDATNEFHLGKDTRVCDGISISSPTVTVS